MEYYWFSWGCHYGLPLGFNFFFFFFFFIFMLIYQRL